MQFFGFFPINQHFLSILCEPVLEVLSGGVLKVRKDVLILLQFDFILLVMIFKEDLLESIGVTNIIGFFDIQPHLFFMIDLI